MSRKINIKSNLSPEELEHVSKSLAKAASSKRKKVYSPENNAEKELLRTADLTFDQMLDSLQEDISNILLEEDK